MSRLHEYYKSDVAPALMAKFNYSSPMQIPRLNKVVINVGAGEAKENPKVIDAIIADLTMITGQKAVATTAKKSVSNFKIRAGQKIGVKVTLRAENMWEFVDKFFNLVHIGTVFIHRDGYHLKTEKLSYSKVSVISRNRT